MEPRGDDGLIERFLKTRGEGIHHISLVMEDTNPIIELCEEKGVKTLGRRFIHPGSSHGVLTELITTAEIKILFAPVEQ
jgi:methylmalonyl-CoA/ethylmalonyl-CoA epimerase